MRGVGLAFVVLALWAVSKRRFGVVETAVIGVGFNFVGIQTVFD